MRHSDIARRMRTALTLLAALGLAGAAAWRPAAAQTYSENAVKAAFLYRFAGYVDWPPAAQVHPQFTIAVLAADGVAMELGHLLQNRQVQNRPAQVRSIKSVSEIGSAQMLYIGADYRDDLRRAIATVSGQPILVVTSQQDGLDAGSAVNFLLLDQRVRFEISVDAAQAAGLRVASELLEVAVRVRGRRASFDAGCEDAATGAPPCVREAAQR